MTVYETVPTEQAHIDELAVTMCQEDIDECWAARHMNPLESLQEGAKVSCDVITGLVDGRVACIFGVAIASKLTGLGAPWMLTAPMLRDHGKAFLSKNKIWMQYQQERWDTLENYVDARHHLAVRWLKWLGFKMDDPAPYGVDGLPFHKFHWENV